MVDSFSTIELCYAIVHGVLCTMGRNGESECISRDLVPIFTIIVAVLNRMCCDCFGRLEGVAIISKVDRNFYIRVCRFVYHYRSTAGYNLFFQTIVTHLRKCKPVLTGIQSM